MDNASLDTPKDFWYVYILLCTASVGIVWTIACAIFIKVYSKLHYLIKIMLYIFAFQNIAPLSTILIGNIIILVQSQKTIITCYLILVSLLYIAFSTVFTCFLISSVRYYMAWKISRQKFANETFIRIAIFIVLIIPMGNISLVLIRHEIYGPGKIIMACCNKSGGREPTVWFNILQYISVLFAMVTTIVLDIKMMFIVKKQHTNAVQPAELIPWKSTIDNEEEDLKIPVRATVVSTFTFLGFAILMVILHFSLFMEKKTVSLELFSVLVTLESSINLPLIVLFCIKQKKEQKNQNLKKQPPTNLQFHGEEKNDSLEESKLEQNCQNQGV